MATAPCIPLDAIIDLASQLAHEPPLPQVFADPDWDGSRDAGRTADAVLTAATAHNVSVDDVWDLLATHDAPAAVALAAVAGPTRHLDALSRSENARVLEAVAQHPDATPAQLDDVFCGAHGSAAVLVHLVAHPRCPSHTIAGIGIELVAINDALIERAGSTGRVLTEFTYRRRIYNALTTVVAHPNTAPETRRDMTTYLEMLRRTRPLTDASLAHGVVHTA